MVFESVSGTVGTKYKRWCEESRKGHPELKKKLSGIFKLVTIWQNNYIKPYSSCINVSVSSRFYCLISTASHDKDLFCDWMNGKNKTHSNQINIGCNGLNPTCQNVDFLLSMHDKKKYKLHFQLSNWIVYCSEESTFFIKQADWVYEVCMCCYIEKCVYLVMAYIKTTLTQKRPSNYVTVSALTTRHKIAIC